MLLRTIEIDFDVHKRIENERRGFDESQNDALRRLLGLHEVRAPVALGGSPPSQPKEKGWSDRGVILPHGTLIRMTYSGRTYEGQIANGLWVIGAKTFVSPSGAAGVAVTKQGKRAPLNGWKYWQVKRPGEDCWTPLDDLPKRELGLSDL